MPRRRSLLLPGLFAVLAFFAGSGCGSPRIPSVEPPPDPLERYPYVQAVTDSSAEIHWTTTRPSRDTLIYWVESPEPGADTLRIPSSRARTRHAVTLAALPAGASVGFRLITPPLTTETHRFRTAPPRGAEPSDSSSASLHSLDTLSVLVFGDSGLGSEAQVRLARRMEERTPDLILHTGDVAYPDGTEFGLTQRHFRVYRHLLAEAPFYPAPGNHDVRTEEGRPFRDAFLLPGSPAGRSGFYGSLDWGTIHFVVLDSTHDPGGSPGEDLRQGDPEGPGPDEGQYGWLVRDLRRASADPATEWIVVVLHHPPFSSGTGLVGHGSDDDLRRVLTPLFDRYGVELVLAGHDHHYERTHPIRSGRIDDATPGTVYVVTGGGGGSLLWRAVGREWYTAKAAFEHHFVTLELADGRMRLTAVDTEGRPLDEYEIRPVPPSRE